MGFLLFLLILGYFVKAYFDKNPENYKVFKYLVKKLISNFAADMRIMYEGNRASSQARYTSSRPKTTSSSSNSSTTNTSDRASQNTSQQKGTPPVEVNWDSSQTKYASVGSQPSASKLSKDKPGQGLIDYWKEESHSTTYQESSATKQDTTNLNEAEAETYLKQGYAYIMNGNVRAALESYNKAISINPNYADAYYGRGYAQHDLGHYQEAIIAYSQAIHINPDYADAYQNRGLTRSVMGDTQDAVKDAEKAAETHLKQNNIDGYNRAKDFVVHILALKLVKGESLNMRAQLPLEAEQLYNTGNTLAMSGHYQEALKSYDQAIALNKSNPMYFNNRASTLKRLGRMQDALTQYHELIKLHPSYGKAHLTMASTYVELNVYSEAVNSYKRFLLAYKSGSFSFNSIVGGKDQTVQGKSELETILFSSINYLLPEQQERAIEVFNEAISQSGESNSTSQSDGFNSTLLNKVLKRINSKIFGYQRGKNYNDMISYLESGNVHMTKEYFKLMAAYVDFNNTHPDDTLAVVVEFWYKSLELFKKTNNLLYLELSKHFLERLSRFIKGTSKSILFINFPIFEDLTEEEQLSFLNYLESYKYS